MAVDNLDTLRRFYAAEALYLAAAEDDRDFAPLASTLDPDVVLRQPASLPYGGEWRGHAGFEAWMRAFATQWAAMAVTGSEFFPVGDVIVTRSHVHATHKPTGRSVAWPLLQYFKFREGRVVELWPFYWDTATLRSQLLP